MENDKLIRASDARRAILKEDPKLAYCIDDIPGVDIAKERYLLKENGDLIPLDRMWIPVSERLPEQTSRCLVARWDYVTDKPFIDILWFEKGVWWNRLHGGNYAVTHWMYLPEPPKE